MRRKDGIFWIGPSLVLVLVLSCLVPISESTGNKQRSTLIRSERESNFSLAGTPHTPIAIDGDANFNVTAQAEGWPGDGSPGNPYIIEGLDINESLWCISISNTRVNFTISNCNLTGATLIDGAGIYLYNVSNALLVNNTCSRSWRGIHLMNASYNTLVNNTCTTNLAGIQLELSSFNTVTDNTAASEFLQDAGIWLSESDHNTVVNNTFKDSIAAAIYLDHSSDNMFANNTCINSDPHIWLRSLSDNNDIRWNVFADYSGLTGRDESTGNVFDYNYWPNYGGPDLDMNGIGDAPYNFLGNSDPHPLMYPPTPPKWKEEPSDLIVDFSFSFFHLKLNMTSLAPLAWYVNDTLFSIDNQGRVTSRSILPIGNYGLTLEVTSIYGLRISSIFSVTVLDASSPSWLIIPIDQELEYGEEFACQVAALDLSGIDAWWVNDTAHFVIDEHGVIRNGTVLEPGMYGLEIRAFDPFDNYCSATLVLTVNEEATVPTTTPTPPSESMDPLVTLIVGMGIGGASVLVIVVILLRRSE
ncbi:MAG: nitrous oxide reductase family maturation protein NosD [Promethearchaeota archaeon]